MPNYKIVNGEPMEVAPDVAPAVVMAPAIKEPAVDVLEKVAPVAPKAKTVPFTVKRKDPLHAPKHKEKVKSKKIKAKAR